jgi:demethylmenaquinone methyltransferase/2-methoxy-6-polyprenyl-1,4-benzoquinol methylase
MDEQLSTRKQESYKIFNDVAPTYDSLNKILSFGIDRYWRRQIRKNLPKRDHLRILDLATGTADVALLLGKEKQVSRVDGIDMSQGMIELGIVKAKKRGLQHKVDLYIDDGCNLGHADHSFDVTTVSFGIRNFPDFKKGLSEKFRVLKPGGRSMIMEFSLPTNPFVKAFYLFYFRNVLPFVGNMLSGHGDAYSYLNQTVEDFPYGEDFATEMRKVGFENVHYKPLTFGIATLYIGDKPQGAKSN